MVSNPSPGSTPFRVATSLISASFLQGVLLEYEWAQEEGVGREVKRSSSVPTSRIDESNYKPYYPRPSSRSLFNNSFHISHTSSGCLAHQSHSLTLHSSAPTVLTPHWRLTAHSCRVSGPTPVSWLAFCPHNGGLTSPAAPVRHARLDPNWLHSFLPRDLHRCSFPASRPRSCLSLFAPGNPTKVSCWASNSHYSTLTYWPLGTRLRSSPLRASIKWECSSTKAMQDYLNYHRIQKTGVSSRLLAIGANTVPPQLAVQLRLTDLRPHRRQPLASDPLLSRHQNIT